MIEVFLGEVGLNPCQVAVSPQAEPPPDAVEFRVSIDVGRKRRGFEEYVGDLEGSAERRESSSLLMAVDMLYLPEREGALVLRLNRVRRFSITAGRVILVGEDSLTNEGRELIPEGLSKPR